MLAPLVLTECFTAPFRPGKPESELLDICDFFDYLEIMPRCNNRYLIDKGTVADDEGLRDINRTIIELGEKTGKPVVAIVPRALYAMKRTTDTVKFFLQV